jgi:hypothetical protein
LQHNKHGTALTAGTINKHLKEQGYGFSVATTKRHLRLLGFYYGKGERRNILHESPQVVDYRSVYLGRRLRNLNANNMPKKVEIFLDESYCHLDHHNRLTWLPRGGIVYEQGRKPMLVIFGAFAVWQNHTANIVNAGKNIASLFYSSMTWAVDYENQAYWIKICIGLHIKP